MKKQLLIGAAVFAAMIPTVAMANEGESSSNLKLVWKNTNLEKAGTSRVYQGHVYNDKYYIMNGAENKVVVFDKDGFVKEIDAPNCWMNFGKDEAGNFILRQSDTFNSGWYADNVMQWTMVLLDPKTDELTVCETKPGGYQNTYGGNNYTFGTCAGDVFGEPEDGAAVMAIAPEYGGTDPIKFWGGDVAVEGAHAGEWDWQYVAGQTGLPSEMIDPVTQASPAGSKVATTCVISVYSWGKKYDEQGYEAYLPEAVALNPHYQVTGESHGTGNSITHLINNGRDEFTWGGFYVTPGHNGMQGFEFFELGDERFVVYTSGEENIDGFSVARVDKDYDKYLRTTPESKPEDAEYLVAFKNCDTDELGTPQWTAPGDLIWCHINSFDVVPSDEPGHVFIYQYVPGAYIAKYDLNINGASAVDEIDITETKVYGDKGQITVIGDEATVYGIDGKLVAKGTGAIACAPGLYVVKTAQKAVKVLVK